MYLKGVSLLSFQSLIIFWSCVNLTITIKQKHCTKSSSLQGQPLSTYTQIRQNVDVLSAAQSMVQLSLCFSNFKGSFFKGTTGACESHFSFMYG